MRAAFAQRPLLYFLRSSSAAGHLRCVHLNATTQNANIIMYYYAVEDSMKTIKRSLMILMIFVLLAGSVPAGCFAAVSEDTLQQAVENAAEYMLDAVKNPQPGNIGGEWAVVGLARSGIDLPEAYYQEYYRAVEESVKACGGVLHEKKYSEYSRLIIAVSAIGKDARNVAGYDLTKPLGDYDKTIWQGLNGPVWALIALDSRDYPMPVDPEAATQATRQMYVDCLVNSQLPDGGWNLYGTAETASTDNLTADSDITGMVLQALSKYTDQPAVAEAVAKAVDCMSRQQGEDGGFATMGTYTCESAVQVMVGLCELGISPEDPRFIKNGRSLLDNVLSYQTKAGGFLHTADGSGNNQLTSEQGFYGMVDALRLRQGKNSLYRMSDAITVADPDGTQGGKGLPGKDPAVQTVPITSPGTTFEDAALHDNVQAIEAMAARGIISGYPDGTFRPERTMTRAEFCCMVTAALGLQPEDANTFADTEGHWAAGRIAAAYRYGIVAGVGNGKFNPGGTITKQEAATMVAAAAKLCGMDIEYDAARIRDTLSPFADYTQSAQWARKFLAFCYDSGILDDSALNIEPLKAVTRAEVAQMLFNLLGVADLL